MCGRGKLSDGNWLGEMLPNEREHAAQFVLWQSDTTYFPHIGSRFSREFPRRAGRGSGLVVLFGVDEPLGLYLPVAQ